jgi:hypothetical protein
MPAPRFVAWEGETWTLTRLATTHHLAPSTLAHRLERFGATVSGIRRALATGVMDCRTAGRRGAARSPWRHPG